MLTDNFTPSPCNIIGAVDVNMVAAVTFNHHKASFCYHKATMLIKIWKKYYFSDEFLNLVQCT